MASASDEVAALDRVLTRLALTEDINLEKVLERLVPAVLDQLKTPHDAVRQKVMEMLSHVNKRLQGHRDIKLPLTALLDQYLDPKASAITRNFALVYLENAFQREQPEQRFAALPKLTSGIGGRSRQHQHILLRLVATALEHVASSSTALGSASDMASRYPCVTSEQDSACLLEFALKVLLYQLPSKGRTVGNTPLSMGMNQISANPPRSAASQAMHELLLTALMTTRRPANQEEAGNGDGPAAGEDGPLMPGGLSKSDVSLVVGKETPTGDTLVRRKLGFLNFTAAAEMQPDAVVQLYVVAACDPSDSVSRRGEELLKKRCGLDSPKPAVNLESEQLVRQLFRLFQGTPAHVAIPQPDRVRPAPPSVRARLMNLFAKSVTAANQYPDAFLVVFDCVYGAETTARLKQAGMEFAVWVFKHAAAQRFEAAGGRILQALLTLLEDEEGAAGSDAAAVALRGFTYQAIGQLGDRVPKVLQSNLDVPRQFFRALETEAPGIRATLQESLSSLAAAYRGVSGADLGDLKALLLESIARPSPGVRYCAAVWANRLLPFDDATARYISALAAGDSKLEVREAGLAGMEPAAFQRAQKLGGSGTEGALAYPSLQKMLGLLRTQHARLRRQADLSERLLLEPRAFLALVGFLRRCRQNDKGHDPLLAEQHYQEVLEHALVKDGTSELHVAALQALLETAAADAAAFAARYQPRLPWLQSFLAHVDEEARWLAAKLAGVAARNLSAAAAESLLGQLQEGMLPKSATRAHKFEERTGAMLASGVLLAQAATGLPQVEAQTTAKVQQSLAAWLGDGDLPMAAAAAQGLGVSCLRSSLRLPFEASASEASGSAEPSTTGGPNTQVAVVEALAALAGGRDAKAAAKAATALGHLAAGDASPALLGAVCKALLGLRSQKGEELQLAVGEALCFAFCGPVVSPETVLLTDFRSLSTFLTSPEGEENGVGGLAAMSVDAGSPAEAAAAPGRGGVQQTILTTILDECIYHSRGEVRSAACIWLASLVSFTGREAALLQRLPEVQEAFGQLLGDANEAVQDIAARGISAVYRLGGESDRQALLTALVSALQGGAKKRRAVKVTGETRVFEDGQLGSAPGGGSLTTYQELCSLATEMGQPDLLYKFMDLANHAASLNSSRGAAFGFASIAKIAGEQLQPYVAQLVPKLYRYQHDPNPRVREGMTNIWRLLVPEPRRAVDEHFRAILAELLREMGGRLWRNREAAALATADLLQGRRWADVADSLAKIWAMAFRALDDIKESVRQAAATLVRTLRGLTLRLADPAHTPAAEAAAAVDATLPLLLTSGLSSSVQDVQALALTTIAKMVQLAQPQQLAAHLPDLTAAMLESLSGMEDSRVNYVEQHAERLGLDSERLESLRVSASRASPMADTLEYCARIATGSALAALVPRLVQLVRRGTGLNTRVGTARFIASLTLHRQREIRPHAAPLIKALVAAASSERSSAVRKAYAASAAALAAYASEEVVASLVGNAAQMYLQPPEPSACQLGGLLAREFVRRAHEALPSHAHNLLPVAYLATSDEDKNTSGLWHDVWQEGATSESNALFLYTKEIVDLLLQGLAAQQWERKRAAAKAAARLAESRQGPFDQHAPALAGALLNELPGRVWEGKEVMLVALAAIVKAAPKRFLEPAAVPSAQQAVEALLTAAQRPSASFRAAAVAGLETVLQSLQSDFYEAVGPLLQEAIAAAQAPLKKEGEGEGSAKPLPLAESLNALAAAWQDCTPAIAYKWGSRHAACLASTLNPDHPWVVRAATLSAATQFVSHLVKHRAPPAGDSEAELGGEEIKWVEQLVPGALAALEEPRISQVRVAALECLSTVVKASQAGKLLSQQVLEDIRQQVEASISREKTASLQSQALSLKNLLGPAPMATD